jgi:TPP-dependent pyruvate/acetoin dehydrogenase alpha subunit
MKLNKHQLINFENEIKDLYEKKHIKAPIHLSGNNEDELINIFKRVNNSDWVFSTWRNHYHALLKGIPKSTLKKKIIDGKSMSIISKKHRFYSSAIVGGCLPIALGVGISLKKKKSKNKVWIFIGDMTFETGVFHECYKYAKNFKLPINFVIEDNGLSTNTPTLAAWGKKTSPTKDITFYKYKRKFPHHGTGSWVLF